MQKDLFEQFEEQDRFLKKKAKLFIPDLKERISLSYENIIFLSIAFIMCSIIFFSLGVEKGRRDINYEHGTYIERQRETIEVERRREPIEKESKVSKNEALNRYLIQIAAFKSKTSAEEEINKLKKNGYNADIKKSGSFYQVYIGSFQSKKEAQKVLDRLKESYQDCYIKTGG